MEAICQELHIVGLYLIEHTDAITVTALAHHRQPLELVTWTASWLAQAPLDLTPILLRLLQETTVRWPAGSLVLKLSPTLSASDLGSVTNAELTTLRDNVLSGSTSILASDPGNTTT